MSNDYIQYLNFLNQIEFFAPQFVKTLVNDKMENLR